MLVFDGGYYQVLFTVGGNLKSANFRLDAGLYNAFNSLSDSQLNDGVTAIGNLFKPICTSEIRFVGWRILRQLKDSVTNKTKRYAVKQGSLPAPVIGTYSPVSEVGKSYSATVGLSYGIAGTDSKPKGTHAAVHFYLGHTDLFLEGHKVLLPSESATVAAILTYFTAANFPSFPQGARSIKQYLTIQMNARAQRRYGH